MAACTHASPLTVLDSQSTQPDWMWRQVRNSVVQLLTVVVSESRDFFILFYYTKIVACSLFITLTSLSNSTRAKESGARVSLNIKAYSCTFRYFLKV